MQTFSTAPKYEIGVYGPRNICIRTSEAGLTKYSFVANMSTGFSGNLGYPMPNNWAFDQFYEGTIGSGSGSIGIDKDGYSGRDSGA
ncbi:glycoside hydrolase domain-containing protein, partial [Enterococcus faecalis]